MVAAGTVPTFQGGPSLNAVAAGAPAICGTSSTGQTTPPALGATMTALSFLGINNLYARIT